MNFCGFLTVNTATKIRCSSREAVSLNALANFPKLRELNLTRSSVTRLDGMPSLKSLRVLSLNYAPVTSLEPIHVLRRLEELDASNTAITNLAGIERLSRLRNLTLWNVAVRDVRPLRSLRRLESLVLGGSQVQTLGDLAGLPNLRAINLERTPIQSLGPLKKLKKLRTIFLAGTHLTREVLEEFSSARPNIRLVGCGGKTEKPCAFRTFPMPSQCKVMTQCCDQVPATLAKARERCMELISTLERLARGAGDSTPVMVRICEHGRARRCAP